ncbi:acyltransferase family protein [Paeniglutamicibacter psychrophenolicus]|uniref:acyltransferase family protein n=1 Tax=Paeniglutamicibacter psychrophenolicus TaxID=257454 RepID=UPI002788712F|nr:acyltransferase family protein [Paeniglutamicibacter psychrophenolicus]MDQ0092878.1 peptidoglycan/LPS O-acetylase OafA/YrhL [Paeniglutamicibacter psychrophenolicus]
MTVRTGSAPLQTPRNAPSVKAPQGDGRGSSMGFREDIQGLRAIAVLMVIVHHLRPGALSGGFIGVDMFFVISGYLITAHLFREMRATGTIKLATFWARRIRRLLPLAFTVLLVSAGMVYFFIPATEHGTMFKHIAAAGLYVENWALVLDATDYTAAGQMATAVQHYWSLSVEEQFYLAWPLLLLGGAFIAGRLVPRFGPRAGLGRHAFAGPGTRQLFLGVIGTITVLSFAYGLWVTAASPQAAYFDTAGRAWQFAAGGIVALLCVKSGVGGALGALLGWGGLAALLAGAVLIPTETRFPGTMGLVPVLGTAAVLAAAGTERPGLRVFSHSTWLSIRPVRWVGDISYGAYLWHWPLIIVAPFVLHTEPKWYHEAGILALTLALAWVSQKLIEDPLRFGAWLKPLRHAYIFALAGMLVLASLAWAGTVASAQSSNLPRMDTNSKCYGAGTMEHPADCLPVASDFAPYPSAVAVSQQVRAPLFPGCETDTLQVGESSCRLGNTANPTLRVAVVGDSHASAWLPALAAIAKARDWELVTHIRSGCSPSVAALKDAQKLSGAAERLCTESVRALGPGLAADPGIDAVIVAAQGNKRSWISSPGYEFKDPATEGFTRLWKQWTDAGKTVAVIGEVPRLGNKNVPTCVASNPGDPLACSVTRKQGLSIRHNLQRALVADTAPAGIVRADLTDSICSEETCFAVIGSLITYYDQSHLSHDFSASLAPRLAGELEKNPVFATGR